MWEVFFVALLCCGSARPSQHDRYLSPRDNSIFWQQQRENLCIHGVLKTSTDLFSCGWVSNLQRMRWKPCSTGDKETNSQKENKQIAPSLYISLMCFWIVLADMVSAHILNHTNTFISVKVEHILCPQGFLIIIDIGVIKAWNHSSGK